MDKSVIQGLLGSILEKIVAPFRDAIEGEVSTSLGRKKGH